MDGRELHARRLALGLSQGALADALAVTQASVSRWEAGARRIPPGIGDELVDLEDRVEDLVAAHLAAQAEVLHVPDDGASDADLAAVAAARALVAQRRAGGPIAHILPTPTTGDPR